MWRQAIWRSHGCFWKRLQAHPACHCQRRWTWDCWIIHSKIYVEFLNLHRTSISGVNTHVEAELNFANWQSEVGHGKHTDKTGFITLTRSGPASVSTNLLFSWMDLVTRVGQVRPVNFELSEFFIYLHKKKSARVSMIIATIVSIQKPPKLKG